jgi:putative phage-type endonuclease
VTARTATIEAPALRKVTPTGLLAATYDLPEAEWLAMRRTGIGGSDVGALLGMSRYKSPFGLYLEKRGELPDRPRSDALDRAAKWGHLHEPLLADEFARIHGLKVRRIGLIRHQDEPWMLANLDRQVAGCPDGPCLLEIKNRSAWKADDWGPSGSADGVPDTEALQTIWYLAVTGYRHAHVAVLINGNDDRYYRIEWDDQLIADVIRMARQFWRRVRDGVPPPLDGHTALTELMATLYAGHEDETAVVDAPAARRLIAERARLKAAVKDIEGDISATENQLRAMAGAAEILTDDDGTPLYTLKQNGNFAPKRFAEADPELAEKYTHLVPAIDAKQLAADHPDTHRAYRARVLRIPSGGMN